MKIEKYGKRLNLRLPKLFRKGWFGIGMNDGLNRELRKEGVLR